MTFFLAMLLVVTVVREQILGVMVPGTASEPPPDLAPGSPVSEALFAGRVSEAIREYGAAMGLDGSAARRAVMQMAARLYRQQPERFVRNPLLSPPVVPRRLVTGLLAAVVAVAAVTGPLAPAGLRPAWIVLGLSNVVVGLALAFVQATSSPWRRTAMIASAVALQASTIMMLAQWNPKSLAVTPILLGIAAGYLTVAWARARR